MQSGVWCGHQPNCRIARWATDPNVQIRLADLADETSLTRELEGCQAAYYLVHSMMSAGSDYAEHDHQLALTFARAAKNAGVKRIIYLGGLGETGPDLSEHLSSRREVEEALASTGVPVTVLRAAMIIGSGSASFEILRYLVERLPVMVTPKWVSTPCQPIAVRNVIGYLVGVLAVPETAGGVFDIGGPDVFCYRDIMRIMAEELGLRRRLIIPVPVLTPRLSSYWIQLITPLSNTIASPLAEGLKNPVVCRDNRIASLIPQELLGVREAIHAALNKMAEHNVETSWSMAGPIPGDPDWAGGTVFRDVRQITVEAPAWAVFRSRVPGWRWERVVRRRYSLEDPRMDGSIGWRPRAATRAEGFRSRRIRRGAGLLARGGFRARPPPGLARRDEAAG